ncbi:MAG: FkbM family methyltransferase, partial [Chitinophagaceae bacterium]|nr:FkbM family methyltransferase [Chitinophagaceae bacterium]
ANIGMFSLYAAHKSKSGFVYAFEPFEENFQMLNKQIEANKLKNIVAIKKGLLNMEGKKDLFLSGINTGGHSIQFEQQAGKVTIDVTTLPQFCSKNNITKIDYLKIDCEGSEFDIWQYDPSILSRVRKIVMECHPYGEETVDKMQHLLESNGFKVIREACNHENIEMLYARKD